MKRLATLMLVVGLWAGCTDVEPTSDEEPSDTATEQPPDTASEEDTRVEEPADTPTEEDTRVEEPADTPTEEDTEVVEGSTEPREPERGPTVDAEQPDKDAGDRGAMRPDGDVMDDAGGIEGGDPAEVYDRYLGDNVKPPPTDDEIPGEGDQEAPDPAFDDRFARVSFDVVSSGEVSVRRGVVIDGTPTLPLTLTGTWVWVADVGGSLAEVGAFLDPLVLSTALRDPEDGGGLPPPADEGTFRITLSSGLLDEEILRRADFVFFELDGSLPPGTVFTPETARDVISAGNGEQLSVVSGERIYEVLEESL